MLEELRDGMRVRPVRAPKGSIRVIRREPDGSYTAQMGSVVMCTHVERCRHIYYEVPDERTSSEIAADGAHTRNGAPSTQFEAGYEPAKDPARVELRTWAIEETVVLDAAKPGDWLQSLTSAERKEIAVSRGLFAYFLDALALVARHSVRANEKHNPGDPVHWARDKSTDHEDCIARHSLAIAVDPDSLDDDAPHIVCRAWRSLAALQVWAEKRHGQGEKI